MELTNAYLIHTEHFKPFKTGQHLYCTVHYEWASFVKLQYKTWLSHPTSLYQIWGWGRVSVAGSGWCPQVWVSLLLSCGWWQVCLWGSSGHPEGFRSWLPHILSSLKSLVHHTGLMWVHPASGTPAEKVRFMSDVMFSCRQLFVLNIHYSSRDCALSVFCSKYFYSI